MENNIFSFKIKLEFLIRVEGPRTDPQEKSDPDPMKTAIIR